MEKFREKRFIMNIKSTLLVIILTALITGTAVFFITTTIGPTSSESSKALSEQNGDAASKERKIIYYPVPKVLNIFLAIHFLHKNPCFEPIFFI
jgi:ABC-type enterobactin transport system permease subunit